MTTETGTYLLVDPAFCLEAFQGVAYSMLLQLAEPGTGERGVDYYERWSDGECVVEWLEVGRLGCNFVWFVSPDPEQTSDYLADKLDTKNLSDLVKLASEAGVGHDELVNLLYRIGYMAPESNADVLVLFEKMMQDSRPTIRRAALNGYMIRRWPQLSHLVATIETSDPDTEVRNTARRVVDLGFAS